MGCTNSIQKDNHKSMQQNSINSKEYFKHYANDGSIHVTKNNRIIKHETCDQHHGALYSDRTVYGSYIIRKYDEGIYKWKIKIHSMKTASDLILSSIIGIDEAHHQSKKMIVAYNKKTDHYGFSSEGETYGPTGYQFSNDTDTSSLIRFKYGTTKDCSRYAIIILSLDFSCNPPTLNISNHDNSKNISWKLNDFNYSTIGYCLAIYSRNVGDMFEILSFQKQL